MELDAPRRDVNSALPEPVQLRLGEPLNLGVQQRPWRVITPQEYTTMEPTGYHLPPPPPPVIAAPSPDDNASLVDVTARLRDLQEVLQEPARRDALEDARLFEFQRALFEGLAIFAGSGLLNCALDIDPSDNEWDHILMCLQDVLGLFYPPATSTQDLVALTLTPCQVPCG